MKMFMDWPWSKHRPPVRLYIHTKKGVWLIGQRSQKMERDGMYGDTYRFVTFHPRKERHV